MTTILPIPLAVTDIGDYRICTTKQLLCYETILSKQDNALIKIVTHFEKDAMLQHQSLVSDMKAMVEKGISFNVSIV